ncbi:serine/threonine-protein kinase SBK1 isoform X2 [Gasterosteus aculeatus]
MTAAAKLLDEMCHLAAQSLTAMDTSEHFRVVKLLGEGSYGKVMLAVHRQRGTPMALKFFPRESTSLFSFLREYNLSLSFCTHPSLTRALGIAYSTPSHYVFAQQASLFGDLYDVILPEVKAAGTKVPEVWYSSPYCTPESEVARGNEDSWSAGSAAESAAKPGGERKKTARVWVSVEPSTDTWALGVLTYAMLTGAHPWAETAGDCQSYLRYREWSDGAKGPDDELDVWAEPQGKGGLVEEGPPVAPQFACFTPLACRFFRTLLDPRPRLRGRPEVALNYLGGVWVMEKERARLEEERKKSGGKVAIRSMKEKEGRGER